MAVMVSSDCQLLVNGQVYAQVSSFSWSTITNVKPIYALDSVTPYELAPTTTRVQGQAQLFRMTEDGGVEGIGATTFFDTFPKQQYITIALRQISTDQLIFQAKYCTVTSQNWTIPSKSIVTGNFIFEGIVYNNEIASATD